MKRFMLILIVCIPLASVVFGGVMMYFAFTGNDQSIIQDGAPMSKTSWRKQVEPQQP